MLSPPPLYEKLVADLGVATGLAPEEAVDVLWLLIQYSDLISPTIRLLEKDGGNHRLLC